MRQTKSKDSSEGASGDFAMMCFKINESQVEGDLEQILAHHTEQPILEVHLEVGHLEMHSEAQPEQSLSLQDWIKRESQFHNDRRPITDD